MKHYLFATFGSLSNRNYRLYLSGQGVSVIGNWMQRMAQAWLVLELSDSGTLLGVTLALQELPTLLLTPLGGVLADRFDKRKVLLCTQLSAVVPPLILGVLTATEHVTIWIVFGLALVMGTIEALDKPARVTFISHIVSGKHLTNAVTLNSIVQNMGKVVGPALAGILIATVGLAYSFLANAGSFLAVVVVLLLVRPDRALKHPEVGRQMGQFVEGLRYVRSRRDIFGPLILMTTTGLLAYNWQVVLPLLARDTFHGDAQVAGSFFSAMGLGAIVGGLAIAGSLRPTINRLVVSGLTFAAFVLALVLAPTLIVASVVLFATGAASVSFRSVATSMLQLRTEPHMRGRVISLLIMATGGTTPFGGPLVGWISEEYGARLALAIGGVSTAVAAIMVFIYVRNGSPQSVESRSAVTPSGRAPVS